MLKEEISVCHIATNDYLANMLAKTLAHSKFEQFREIIAINNLQNADSI